MKDNDVEIVLSQKTSEELQKARKNRIDFQLQGGPSFDKIQDLSRRSQALQSLINQNEDLMARLKAATIRSGQLEGEIEEKELEIQRIRREREDLYEQNIILREKELIFRERVEKSLQKAEDLKEENSELLGRLEKVERAFRRLFKYREKVRRHLPHFKSLRRKASRLTDVNSHLKTQIEELTARLQKIHSEMSESQANLVADYEVQIRSFESQLAESQRKAIERDEYKQSSIQFENRCIEVDRELAQLKHVYSKESQSLKADLDQYRQQTKQLLIQCETLKSQMTEKTAEHHEQKQESERLADQVESLQILWKEKQEDLERAQEKNKSLQRLNQDISQRLNEAKRDVALYKRKLETEQELLNRIRQVPRE